MKYQASYTLLQAAGLRATQPRLALAAWLFQGRHRHVTAEQARAQANRSEKRMSLATVYNTLNAFKNAGLLRSFAVDAGQTIFDTNTEEHYHLLDEKSGKLQDVPVPDLGIRRMPKLPAGKTLGSIDIVIRMR